MCVGVTKRNIRLVFFGSNRIFFPWKRIFFPGKPVCRMINLCNFNLWERGRDGLNPCRRDGVGTFATMFPLFG